MNFYLVTVLLILPSPGGPLHYEAYRQPAGFSSGRACQAYADAEAERLRQVYADAVRRGATLRGVCKLQDPMT